MNVRQLFEQAPGEVLTTSELRPYLTRHRLGQLVGKGKLFYDGRGTYRLRHSDERHAVARELRGVLSHRSAAEHWRLPLAERPAVTEVTIARSRSQVPDRDDAQIYYRTIGPGERDGDVTTLRRTLLDCARDIPAPEALAMADAAVRTGKADKGDLIAAAAELRGPRSGNARRVMSWIDPRAMSILESVNRGILLDAGITGIEPQFAVAISTGHVLHADLGHREARLLIESESNLAHSGYDKLASDSLRYTEFAAAGYVVLRFTWLPLMQRRSWVADMVRQTIKQRS
jgi:hypothetical protein